MTNSTPDATGFEFWQRQIDRLGDRDPLEVLASTPDALHSVVTSRSADRFAVRPFPGKWSPAEVMGHLVDIEFVFGYRVRTMLADADPAFGGIDQDRWVEEQGWHAVPPDVIAARFASVRGVNLSWWKAIPADAMTRTGRHSEADVELTLGHLLHILAGHDLVHLDQLLAFLDAAG